MSKKKDIPVYLFTGFLEAGKTRFIQETMEDKRFCNGERTLLLVCEEGEEEYAPEQFADRRVYLRVIREESELQAEKLQQWLDDVDAERVVIEFNGTIIISSGATLDLTGNTNVTPIAPGGGITLDASPSSGVVIIGNAGSGTQTRTFAGGGTITGSAITNTGAISGATVTLPSSSCQIEFVKSGETVVSSAFIQASDTPYVLETQQGAGAVLVRAIED